MSETPPWQVLSSRTVVRDRWIDVTADACRDARGNILDPFYTFNYPDWVHVVAITPADELVMVRQYRHGARASSLELPAGRMDPSDTSPLEGAARELREETGYAAPALRLISSLSPNTVTHRNRVHTVLALDAVPAGPTAHEAGEDITVELWPLERLLAGIPQGLMLQALDLPGLFLALHAIGRLSLELRPR
ncbi:NUDIX hydrolase [Roseomonas sp. E05]|uniref:NUDIX hydrolase n=1 Tax=Roseomonas sp. E05 TaxID=3046310 RepID=UPI0024B9C85C|nr:NUDIX hydrolase [Roseomonas sp. E05]MDJ0390055.1 NUDIX hydrolase [Roseomonas sp. E05]